MIKSFFLKLFAVIIVVVFQFALLPRIGLHNYIDLLLPLLVFWILLEKYNFVYFMTFLGGIIFDLFSGLPLGSKTIIYLLIVSVLILVRKNLIRSFTPTTFIVIALGTVFGFHVFEKTLLLTLGLGNHFVFSVFVEIIFEVLLIFILSFFARKKLYS